MKKWSSRIIIAVLAAGVTFSGLTMPALAEGNTEDCIIENAVELQNEIPDGVHEIYTKEDFYKINNDVSASYILMNDLDFSEEENFESIPEFSGIFDGNGHTISSVHKKSDLQAGIFLELKNAEIRNLTVKNSNFDVVNYDTSSIGQLVCIGSIAASGENSVIENITAENVIISCKTNKKGARVGGIIGYGYASGISLIGIDSAVDITITEAHSDVYTGGIAGDDYCYESDRRVENCTFNGNITVEDTDQGPWIGGICGSGNTIINCNNYGTFLFADKTYSRVGGIAGYAGKISSCNNFADLIYDNSDILYLAGIAGQAQYVKNCTNYGKIYGSFVVAGILADDRNSYGEDEDPRTPAISGCLNKGEIRGEHTAGIVTEAHRRIENCKNEGKIVGSSEAAGIAEGGDTCTIYGCDNYGAIEGDYLSAGICFSAYKVEKCGNYASMICNGRNAGIVNNIGEGGVIDCVDYKVLIHSIAKQEAQNATCASYGVKEYYFCEMCNKCFEDGEGTVEIADIYEWKNNAGRIEKTEHNYSGEWIGGSRNHWHQCTVCGNKKDVTAHSGGSALCNSQTMAICAVCHNEYTSPDATVHVWNDYYTTDIEATYTKKGQESIHCSRCNTKKSGSEQETPFKTGYDWETGYFYQNGSKAVDQWFVWGSDKYLLDSEGNKLTGWQYVDGHWYYLKPSSGVMAKGWTQVGNGWYALDYNSGVMLTGWVEECGWHYMDLETGAEVRSKWVDGGRYYIDENGIWDQTKKNEWKKDSKGWWYRHANGTYTRNAWEQIGGVWYHFDNNGYMESNKWIGSYYVKSSGAMAKSEWVDGDKYYVDANGVWDKTKKNEWKKDSNGWWYRHANGSYTRNGWEQIGGAWYHFDKNGYMETNKWVGDYFVKSDGKMATSCWIGKYYVGPDGKWQR